MSAPTREDAALIVQIGQWMAAMDYQSKTKVLFSDDFDPETADPRDEAVGAVLGMMETIGTFVKNDLLSGELVHDWLWLEGLWSKVGPAALKAREAAGEPRIYENFEAMVKRS